ncbi:M4 family metallopeptidase [Flavobacterium sp.]|uniref:M4 family metallopeptidase n=1 Tax=Flavobacterium sp. TaxID=239 RepID=UPI0025F6CF65|nr:M4 family metallopeptidase [Flavobacterium sp.]
MKKYYIILLVVYFSSFNLCNSQTKYNENSGIQKSYKFNNTVNRGEAIAFYLKRNGLDTEVSFVSKKETTDQSGMVHQRNQQFYKGIKIEFGTLITHTLNGNVISINSELYNPKSVNSVPTLTSQIAFNKALLNIGAQKYLWEDNEQAKIMDYEKPNGELVFFPIVKTGEITLAYKFDIYSIEPLSRIEIFVDAHSGKILYKNPIIKHLSETTKSINENAISLEALLTGTAATKYSGSRSIETVFNTSLGKYVLSDITRGNGVVTYNCERLVNTYQNVHFQDNDNNWTSTEHANSYFDNAALDAHWGAEMTYDFWKIIFNRNGYDNNNAIIKNYVHFQRTAATLSNAFWNGSVMSYGDGVNKPFTAIDICGHEIGHAVCTYTVNLAYQNQSGAMNEGYSDIWGACIEHFGKTGNFSGVPAASVWKIGEDITSGGLRSMVTPNTNGDPDCFQGTNWKVTGDEGTCIPSGTSNDYCGVHSNSGVMNRWFYVLTMGASGTNNAPIADRDTYNVTGIGIVKSSQIAYYAERDYLTPNSTYFDARDATIEVAKSLYCSASPEVAGVTNAWFAVNVGNSYVSVANDVSQESLPVNNSVNCGVTSVIQTVSFKNLGTSTLTSVTISYNLDGGTNTNIVWNGSLSTCATGSQQITINTSSLSAGTHILNVTTTTSGDAVVSNNAKSTYIFVNQSASVNQINTFESASDNLLASNEPISVLSVWQRGIMNKPNLTDSSNVYATGLTNPYPSDTKSYLTSRCYDLSQAQNPILKFDMAFDLQYSADILYMQYSANGGNSWNLLGTDSNTNWYTSNSGCANCIGSEWTGDAGSMNASGSTNGTKREYSYDLSAFGATSPSPQSNMLFRFVFQSDATDSYDGALIDNFVIETSLGTNEFLINDTNIYPNPVKGILNYTISDQVVLTAITIHDVSGKEIYKSGNTINNVIDVSSLSSGVYFVTFKSDKGSVSKKFIKE